jgi:uncharacterized protein (TIGR00290 family)
MSCCRDLPGFAAICRFCDLLVVYATGACYGAKHWPCGGFLCPAHLISARFPNHCPMTKPLKNAAMLWSGGKDCCLALYHARQAGYAVCCLVTFAPPQADFLAHPLPLMQMQAHALGLPHHIVTINAPFEQAYEAALRRLREEMGIDWVITGDIAPVDGLPNWIRERSRPVGMQVHTPLWARERAGLLRELIDLGFDAYLSCIDTGKLAPDWLGRRLNLAAMHELQAIGQQNGLDLCGENGEYHSMVLAGPMFGQRIEMPRWSPRQVGALLGMAIGNTSESMLSSREQPPATGINHDSR